jgi:LysM repeat protein
VGKHRAPRTGAETVVKAVITTGLMAAVSVPTMGAASAAVDPDTVRAAIIQCESGNRNIEHGGDPGGESSASGYYQFVDDTWAAFGGKEFAPRAIQATRAEQDIVFDRAIARNGTADWEADPRSEACWRPKIGKVSAPAPSEAAPKRSSGKTVAPQTTGKHRKADTEIPDGYVVKPGDTLSKIRNRFDVSETTGQIAKANGIANPNRIFPGQVLN